MRIHELYWLMDSDREKSGSASLAAQCVTVVETPSAIPRKRSPSSLQSRFISDSLLVSEIEVTFTG